MPALEQVSYSRSSCITAVRGYYSFLASMYLDPSIIAEPPEDGWPDIDQDALGDLKKTDEVIVLLRHLPYIREPPTGIRIFAGPHCHFTDWERESRSLRNGEVHPSEIKVLTEGAEYSDQVPAHVIGLAIGNRNAPVILLDTLLGVVYWDGCPTEVRKAHESEEIFDDPYDWAPQNEAEWRADAACWPVATFFDVLKSHFLNLSFVPISPTEILDEYETLRPDFRGMIPMLQQVYREHHWPDLSRYCKADCLSAVESALRERYPQFPI
ncbi:hypothetical protein IQ07DRAFT_643564 [Pyrenochaeta sp. DS3sAY3a]|nr:hypothetical protein IQ07DRAFT_643564 [Pyrenochaeta sp. DS3sAY3a]